MYYSIVVDVDKCNGCGACQTACSLYNERECNPNKSRIGIVKTEEQGMIYSIPVFCRQCENPVCMAVCPAAAIYRDIKTGAVVIDEEKCIGCRSCVYACPFGAITMDFDGGVAIKCTLCGGDPRCVRFCGSGAIKYIRNDKINIMLKRKNTGAFLEFQKVAARPTQEEV